MSFWPSTYTEHEDTYHAQRGRYLTAGIVKDILAGKTWEEALQKDDGRSEAFQLGSAAHAYILEGRSSFNDRFTVGGPINKKTGRPYSWSTQAHQEWAATQTTDTITTDQYDLVIAMAEAVFAHPAASKLLASGQAEQVYRRHMSGVPCQVKADFLSDLPALVDLKTCSGIDIFEADAAKYYYVHQLAFYLDVLDTPHMPAFLIAVEKAIPSRCLVLQPSPAELARAYSDNMSVIESVRHYFSKETIHADNQ